MPPALLQKAELLQLLVSVPVLEEVCKAVRWSAMCRCTALAEVRRAFDDALLGGGGALARLERQRGGSIGAAGEFCSRVGRPSSGLCAAPWRALGNPRGGSSGPCILRVDRGSNIGRRKKLKQEAAPPGAEAHWPRFQASQAGGPIRVALGADCRSMAKWLNGVWRANNPRLREPLQQALAIVQELMTLGAVPAWIAAASSCCLRGRRDCAIYSDGGVSDGAGVGCGWVLWGREADPEYAWQRFARMSSATEDERLSCGSCS